MHLKVRGIGVKRNLWISVTPILFCPSSTRPAPTSETNDAECVQSIENLGGLCGSSQQRPLNAGGIELVASERQKPNVAQEFKPVLPIGVVSKDFIGEPRI